MPTEVHPVRRALLDTLPLVLGYVPFGLVYGATVQASIVSDLAGWAASPIVFAGASQLAMVGLLDDGAAVLVVVLTALVINVRHVMYSGAMATWFRDQPRFFQVTGPFLLTDPVYSLSIVRFPTMPDARARRTYYTTVGVAVLANWTVTTAAGVVLGNVLPAGLDLGVAVPLVFLALVVPMIDGRPALAAAVVGGLVTLAGQGLPLHLGLLVGASAGVAAGLLLDPEVGGRPRGPEVAS